MNTNNFEKNHLNKFKECFSEPGVEEPELGFNISEWWQYVSPKLETKHTLSDLPHKKLTRTELKEICCKNSGASDLKCAISIMAWGGKNRKHGVTLFNHFNKIEPIISDMRNGKISHYDAYKDFDRIWQEKENIGMGAAYFTKLIFFCDPEHKGYIMDQWTSKSVNLLTGQDVVSLTSTGYVGKKNTVNNYRNFCENIERLAKELKTSGENIEIALFSKGGRKKWPWRQYITTQDGL